jgi:Protein of unknown function (DUF3307)
MYVLMQPFEIFLAFYLGHLATDFLLQTNAMAAGKKTGSASAYFYHGLTHYLTVVVIFAFASPASVIQLRFQITLLALTAVHLPIDLGKSWLTAPRRIVDGISMFLADQAVHFVSVVVAAALYSGFTWGQAVERLHALRAHREQILAVLVVYTAVVFAAGYVVRYLTKSLLRNLRLDPESESRAELQNAGLYIGWLERILVVTAIALRSPGTIGLVLTAKSIVRYPELKSGRFAEYFLIGTLLSIILAILGGIVLLKLFYGTVSFSP